MLSGVERIGYHLDFTETAGRALLSNAEAGWICSRKASAGLERSVGEMQLSSD